MMTLAFVLVGSVGIVLTVGYIFGMNDVDPDSEFGKEYYNKENYDYV